MCSREMDHYRKQEGAENIAFVDICSSDFDATKEALDPLQVHKVMHVRRKDGTIATRVDAFIAIWETLPRFKILAKIAKARLIKPGLEVGYSCFAAIRPILPRYSKNADCQDSPYCELKN